MDVFCKFSRTNGADFPCNLGLEYALPSIIFPDNRVTKNNGSVEFHKR